MTHKTIAALTEDLDNFRYNRGVARLRELSNHLEEVAATAEPAELRESLEAMVGLLAPMMPHLGEELWRLLGHDTMLVDGAWPEAEPALTRDDVVTMAVQVNGKLRATLDLARDLDQDSAREAALASPAVQRALEGKPVRKVIVVPNRIINVVV